MTAPPVVARADDIELLRQSYGEPERFAVLFDRYFPDIHRFVANRLGPTVADDVAAETFLVAFDRRTSFEAHTPSGGHVRAWLYGIATNLVRRHHRSEERRYRALARAPQDPHVVGHDDRIAAMVSAQSVRRELAEALAALSARDRDVLLLVALGDLNYHEVATALGIPYGTVCSRLNRARRKVRKALGDTGPIPDVNSMGAL